VSLCSIRTILLSALVVSASAGVAQGPPGRAGAPRPVAQPAPNGARPPAAAPPDSAAANGDARDTIELEVGERGVSLYAVAADAHELLTKLARATGLRLIVDDTVKRNITVNLVNRPVSEVLGSIVSTYGLSCKEVDGIFIVSEGIPTSPSSYLLSDIDSISTKYVLSNNAKSLLPVFLQDNVKTNPEQNAVILSAPTEILKKFREDIAQFDIPAAQIMVDVLMVEFTDTGAREFGSRWGWTDNGRSIAVDGGAGSVVLRGIATLTPDFHTDLRAMVSGGKARVRANPRIATVSGREASVFIGKQQYLSTPVVMGDGYNQRQTYSIDAGVRLNVTPWTGGEDEIIVDVQPEISVLSAPDPKTGLPEKSTRRADTTVLVRSGQTIIIGGLNQREAIGSKSKVPGLGDAPVVGSLFRSREDNTTTTEMVVFITPRILSLTGHLPESEEEALRKAFLEGDEAGKTAK
jgi:type II secretory pathway component GspD/PulD (secretin)